jgi:L-fuculose-phosphate aldolase
MFMAQTDLTHRAAAVCHQLASSGLVRGTGGNVSVRDSGTVLVTPTGAELAQVSGEDLARVTLAGEQVDGPYAPTSELDLHLAVYADHPDAGAVIHTHAPIATALSCVLDELPCVHYEMLLLGGTVRVAPYATFGTPELAQSVRDALQGRRAALLANHGTVTYGGDLDEALKLADLLEWAASVYWHAQAIGTPRVLDEADRQKVVEAAIARNYGSTQEVER